MSEERRVGTLSLCPQGVILTLLGFDFRSRRVEILNLTYFLNSAYEPGLPFELTNLVQHLGVL
jgi:hypothetical protein